jgi:uncharacterized membrane protein YebE (DUF533 family)
MDVYIVLCLISVAWADGKLQSEEGDVIEHMIAHESCRYDEKQRMLDCLNEPVKLGEVVSKITDHGDKLLVLQQSILLVNEDNKINGSGNDISRN